MSFKLVTGRAGRDHVTSDDVGVQNALLFGLGRYVLDTLTAEIIDNNTIHVSGFNALIDGRHFRCSSEGEDLTISNGAQNRCRKDLIAIRYALDISGADFTESGEIVVLEGEQVLIGSEPPEPQYAQGSILDGDILVEIPLFSITINGTEVIFDEDYRLPSYCLPLELGGTGAASAAKALIALGAAAKVHAHGASDITSGTLPIDRGGTGKASIAELSKLFYPVGAVYISYDSKSPASLFGGEWTKITGRFLRMAEDVNTGGADTVSIAHTHGLSAGYGLYEIASGGFVRYKYKSNVTQWTANYGLNNAGTSVTATDTRSSGLILGGNTDSGGGTAINNMPAYQDLYAWRRTG